MQGTTGGRNLEARYYCSTRRADRSCDQPIAKAEHVERQLAQFITGFVPSKGIRGEILCRLASSAGPESSEAATRPAGLEDRLLRMRDLYELGDLERTEYIARRDAIHAELNQLAPQPTPDLDQAQRVLEDFTVFWENEQDPDAKRRFLHLIFQGVWLDENRVVAVQPKPHSSPSSRTSSRRQRPERG
jgi:hypothetical protein